MVEILGITLLVDYLIEDVTRFDDDSAEDVYGRFLAHKQFPRAVAAFGPPIFFDCSTYD